MKKTSDIILGGVKTKLNIVFCIIFAIGAGFLVLYANNLLIQVINDYLLAQNFDGFAFIMFMTIGAFVLVYGMNICLTYLWSKFQYDTLLRLTGHYITRLLRAKSSFFTNLPSADLFTKLYQSTYNTSYFVVSLLSAASHTILFVFYGIIIFRIDFLAGIFAVVAVPFYFFLTMTVGDKLSELASEQMNKDGEISTLTQEAFESVNNIKAKGAYSFFTARPLAVLKEIKRIMMRTSVFEEYFSGITRLINLIVPILVIVAAIRFSSDFTADAGVILVLYINIPHFLNRFALIFEQYLEYKTAKPFLAKLREFNDVELESEKGLEIANFESLSAKGVKVEFSGGSVITVPDFEVKSGEKVMFFGESGIGKSTIFNIIMGFNQEYEGTVLVNGINLREISFASLRKIFGITFQNTSVITQDLRSNILLGADKSDKELERLLQLTSLENQYDAKSNDILNNKVLSGGEKSRVGLSQMLVLEPQIMLIDEAFSNMDEELESQIINNLFKEYPKRAMICISHRNSSRPFFDRVVDFNTSHHFNRILPKQF